MGKNCRRNYRNRKSIKSKTKNFAFLLIFILSLCLKPLNSWAQAMPYHNQVFSEHVKSVVFGPIQQEQNLPLIHLNSSDQLIFKFDDLQAGFKSYKYSIEHCQSNWTSSGLNTIFYLDGFKEELLNDYKYSIQTYQKYTHYRLVFPNQNMKPKISGNYVLKVYDDKNKLVITRRFYVLDSKISVQAKVEQSPQVTKRNSHQKIQIQLNLNEAINNPQQDIKVQISQNQIPFTLQQNTKPNLIRGNQLFYNAIDQNEFSGSNEFRKFDIRSLRAYGAQVKQITVNKNFEVELFTDQKSSSPKYSNQFDENGLFFIRNNDGINSDIDGDYANVTFSLKIPQLRTSKIYVLGAFNAYQFGSENELIFNLQNSQYETQIKLKQGLYDYKYVIVDSEKGIQADVIDSSFYETQNTYQIFVYYKKPGARYEELWALQEIKN